MIVIRTDIVGQLFCNNGEGKVFRVFSSGKVEHRPHNFRSAGTENVIEVMDSRCRKYLLFPVDFFWCSE